MYAEVCVVAGVAQCTLEFAQVALEFVAGRYRVPEKASRNKPKTIQPISKKIPKLFQTSSETCPPRAACRDFRKACSPPHPGVARTTPGIVGIS